MGRDSGRISRIEAKLGILPGVPGEIPVVIIPGGAAGSLTLTPDVTPGIYDAVALGDVFLIESTATPGVYLFTPDAAITVVDDGNGIFEVTP